MIDKNKLVCAYCGKVRDRVMFCIGASVKPDWTMVQGTGKVTCPDCYDKAMGEATIRKNAYINSQNY